MTASRWHHLDDSGVVEPQKFMVADLFVLLTHTAFRFTEAAYRSAQVARLLATAHANAVRDRAEFKGDVTEALRKL